MPILRSWVLAYSAAWLLVMDIAKRVTYSAIDRSGLRVAKYLRQVTQALGPHVPVAWRPGGAP